MLTVPVLQRNGSNVGIGQLSRMQSWGLMAPFIPKK
jgi:hypothetical protein